MKMLPLVFQQRFKNCGDEQCARGFTPYEVEKGLLVDERIVEITPSTWVQGSCLVVTIKDKCYKLTGGEMMRECHKKWIYDRPVVPTEDQATLIITPTEDQATLIAALATNELRGKFAEKVVFDLFIDLCIMNPKFNMKEYLPEVVNWYTAYYDKHKFTVKSK